MQYIHRTRLSSDVCCCVAVAVFVRLFSKLCVSTQKLPLHSGNDKNDQTADGCNGAAALVCVYVYEFVRAVEVHFRVPHGQSTLTETHTQDTRHTTRTLSSYADGVDEIAKVSTRNTFTEGVSCIDKIQYHVQVVFIHLFHLLQND